MLYFLIGGLACAVLLLLSSLARRGLRSRYLNFKDDDRGGYDLVEHALMVAFIAVAVAAVIVSPVGVWAAAAAKRANITAANMALVVVIVFVGLFIYCTDDRGGKK